MGESRRFAGVVGSAGRESVCPSAPSFLEPLEPRLLLDASGWEADLLVPPGDPLSKAGDGIVNRRALLVGISEGSNLWTYADLDLQTIEDALLGAGWDQGDITVLHGSSMALRPTMANFQTQLQVLRSASDDDDVSLVYFTGHGNVVADQFSGGDEWDGWDETLVFHDAEMSDDMLGNILMGAWPGQLVMVLDSCFSGGMIDGTQDPGALASNVELLAASQADEESWGDGTYGSYFTYYFAQAIDLGMNTARTAFNYAQNRTRIYEPAQWPTWQDNYPGDIYLFGTATTGDIFEPNDSFAEAADLGILGVRIDSDLSIHSGDGGDFYVLTTGADGTLNVEITFSHISGDLDLYLYDADFNEVAYSDSAFNDEYVSYEVLAGEIYYIEVRGYSGATNPSYELTVDGPEEFVNHAPEVRPNSYGVNEDAIVTINAAQGVLGNDSDPEGDPITAVLVTDVSHGTLTLNADGSFTYEPEDNYNGKDSFTYLANDGELDSRTVTVTFVIHPVNDRPVGLDQPAEVDEDASVEVVLDVSDLETPVANLAFHVPLRADHGSLTPVSAGVYLYTPDADYNGDDTFTYTVTDTGDPAGSSLPAQWLQSDPATVTITVRPVNDAPAANARNANTDIGKDVQITLSGSDLETAAGQLSYGLVDEPLYGHVELVGNIATYTPDPARFGGDHFTFAVQDTGDPAGVGTSPALRSAPATVTVNVVAHFTRVGEGGLKSFTVPDDNGHLVTVKVTGPGYADVHVANNLTYNAAAGDVRYIVLGNTSWKTTLTVTVEKGCQTNIGKIEAKASLNAIVLGSGTVLSGNISIGGLLKRLAIDDATGGRTVEINSGNIWPGPRDAVTMVFDRVSDIAINTYRLAIASLTATEWLDADGLDNDSITAPRLGKLKIAGRKRGDLSDGNFQADLFLNGADGRGYALGSAIVVGEIACLWDVQGGNVGTIQAGSAADTWQLHASGGVSKLLFAGDLAGQLQAEWFGSINTKGDLRADVAASGEKRGVAIGPVKALVAQNASLSAPNGGIKSINVLRWVDDAEPEEIAAGWLGSLTVSGRVARRNVTELIGDFQTDLDLSGLGVTGRKLTLGNVKIAGAATGAWSVTGPAGTIRMSGTVDGWTLDVANGPAGSGLVGKLAGLLLGEVDNAEITVDDALGTAKALRWGGGKLEADQVRSLTVTGKRGTKTVAAVPGDFRAELVIHGQNVSARGKALSSATIAGCLDGAVWDITGPTGTVTVKGDVVNSQVVLTHDADSPKPALARMTVKGVLSSSRVLSTGDIGTFTAAAMENSDLYAGVQAAVAGLPDPYCDLLVGAATGETARIGTVTILGRKVNRQYVTSFANSNIAAYEIGRITFCYAETDNGEAPFGVACRQVGSLTYRQQGLTVKWPGGYGLRAPEDLGDLCFALCLVPQFVEAHYIDPAAIDKISRFRSGEGQNYCDSFESARSMEHCFVPLAGLDWSTVEIFAPVTGTITGIEADSAGARVAIRPDNASNFEVVIFHVNLQGGLKVGDQVAAGQKLGTHIGSQTWSDIAIEARVGRKRQLFSYFDVMPDGLFADFQALGVTGRDELIIAKSQRDADPLTCQGEQFVDAGHLDNWVDLP